MQVSTNYHQFDDTKSIVKPTLSGQNTSGNNKKSWQVSTEADSMPEALTRSMDTLAKLQSDIENAQATVSKMLKDELHAHECLVFHDAFFDSNVFGVFVMGVGAVRFSPDRSEKEFDRLVKKFGVTAHRSAYVLKRNKTK